MLIHDLALWCEYNSYFCRPVVSVYQHDDPSQKSKTVVMPRVLASPLRPDLVRFIHMNMSKNKRQAYALAPKQDMEQQQNHGALDVLWPVSLVFQEVVPTVQDRQHLATCAVVEACSAQPRCGAGGTERSM